MVRTGTYSIVALDARAGQLGVAVQTHWFAVGAIVPWARAGVGALATQANANVSFGLRGLELLESGISAPEVLGQLISEDPGAAGRQLAIVDRLGEVAVYTGEECFAFAGHVTGDGWSCQANLMASADVWPAMAAAYEAADGPLAERMLEVLRAGQEAGGDVRGRQSAALEIVPLSGQPWDRAVSLRVDDHPDPVPELTRLYRIHRAYALATDADWALGEGRLVEAGRLYQDASELDPENHELLFWAGLGAAQAGDVELGVQHVRDAIALHAGWQDLLARLPDAMFPAIESVRAALRA